MNMVLCVSYIAKPGMREAFLKEIESLGIQEKVEREAGCIRYEYYRSARNEDELLLVEKWESEGHQAEACEAAAYGSAAGIEGTVCSKHPCRKILLYIRKNW